MKSLAFITTGLLVIGLTVLGCSQQMSGQGDAGWVTLLDGSNPKTLDNWDRSAMPIGGFCGRRNRGGHGCPAQASASGTVHHRKLVPMMDEAGVDRAVIVPPSWPGDRNDYAQRQSATPRFAVMGRIPLQDRNAAPKWSTAGCSACGSTMSWLSDGTADWFWPAAEKPVPVMFLRSAAPVRPIASAIQLTLIIDHMGVSWEEKRIPTAIEQAVALAKYPNVSKDAAAPHVARIIPFRDVTEHLRRVFDAYGPQRSTGVRT